MKPTVLVAVVLILTIVGHDRPVAFAQTMGTAAPQSIGAPSSTHGEQTVPGSDSRTAPLPDLQGFPAAPAPSELATLVLPDNFTQVTALFKRLPPEVAGHARLPEPYRMGPDSIIVEYGRGEPRKHPILRGPALAIRGRDLTSGDFFPTNWKGGHVVAMMALRNEGMKEFGRDGDLFWVREEGHVVLEEAGSPKFFPMYSMLWGRINSPWVFNIMANTPEGRDALLAAFVAAAKSAQR